MNVHEAKTHLSRLLEQVAAGDDITIARAGKPIARLVPVGEAVARRLGADAGRVVIDGDFDAPLSDDTLADFEP